MRQVNSFPYSMIVKFN